MGKVYLTNAFSINMLKEFPATITIDKLDEEEFCLKLEERLEDGRLINAIGHDSTVNLINTLCGTQLQKNRVEVKMDEGDVALIIMISQRLEEAKVLSNKEIEDMYRQGKITFYEVWL
jgi:predicted RNase H-like nuclease (RuvC/YqgF family)